MPEDLILHPIGIIRTPFTDKYSAPRQPGADGEFPIGRVILEKGHNFEQALCDLDGFEKIWLIYRFDRNTNWKPKVLPPRSTVKRGVFSTRSPHRPNPLGLSLVTLLDIRGRTLTVEGVDMLDKTPLFDIKPYLPEIESFPQARTGWVSENAHPETPQHRIDISADVIAAMGTISSVERDALVSHIHRMLRFDIRPHPYKRISAGEADAYVLAYKHWRIGFRLRTDSSVEIFSLRAA